VPRLSRCIGPASDHGRGPGEHWQQAVSDPGVDGRRKSARGHRVARGEIIAGYGHGDKAKAEYDGLKKTAAASKAALGKVAAVQA